MYPANRLFTAKIKPGKTSGTFRAVSMPIAMSDGMAKGQITVPAVPAPETHLAFSAVFGGCVCASHTDFEDYCVPNPAPATPADLATDIADFFNSSPDTAQYLYFVAIGSTITYTSILPGLVVTTLDVPGGFAHTQTNNGLIACQEFKPGRAVVTNPCRVPTAENPYAVALQASADPADSFVGVSRLSGGCNCECDHKCGCGCFTAIVSGEVGIELSTPIPTCPLSGPLMLAYSQVDGRFAIYSGALPAAHTAVAKSFRVIATKDLSAVISF